MQGGQAIGVTVEHVEFVREFVDDQVIAFPAAAGHDARPGENDRPLLPGFTAVFAVPLVLDAAGIAMALGAEEVVGVEHDFVKTLIPVQFAEVEQGQLGLGGEQQPLFLVQFDPRQGRQVFVFEEQHAGFAQPLVLLGADAVEEAQVMANPLPHIIGDRVPGQDAPATPGAERPHRSARFGFGCTAAEAAAEHTDDHRHQR
ncbi:hypothetical protein D3C73_1150690 [compost metagenome]